jgi:Listeria/Bacterioides repeat
MEKKQVFVILGVVVAITIGIIAYCLFIGNQYTVKFDSTGGSEVAKQLVNAGKKAEEPKEPIREGYEFIEWQLNGKKFDFNSKIKRNTTLKAKWTKVLDAAEKFYTVKFNSDGGSSVSSQSVAAGEPVTKPTNPVKEGYTFEGWYIGNTKYDFSKKITQDTEIVAKWKAKSSSNNSGNNKPSVSGDLKVGDRVKIVGEYASSSTSKEAIHTRAKGWKRIILKIYDGTEYPYRVGNDTGTTGFFKAESLEKID